MDKSSGRVTNFPPPDRLVILKHFLQNRLNVYTAVTQSSQSQQVAPRAGEDEIRVGEVTDCTSYS